MIEIILLILIYILIANIPEFVKKHLTHKIAIDSEKSQNNFNSSKYNPLPIIEWIRLYPLKKMLLALLWLFSLFITFICLQLVFEDPSKGNLFFTFCSFILIFIIAFKYIKLSYHCIPVLNQLYSKKELKAALKGEYFKEKPFNHKWLQKNFYVLTSKNWVLINGYLISRKAIKKIYFTQTDITESYVDIYLVYFNDKKFKIPTNYYNDDEQCHNELVSFLHTLTANVIVNKDN